MIAVPHMSQFLTSFGSLLLAAVAAVLIGKLCRPRANHQDRLERR